MHDRTTLTELRIDRFLRERLRPAVYRRRVPLTVTAYVVDGEPVPFATAAAATYRPFEVGQPWGRPWDTTWFAVSGEIPAGWRGPDGALPSGTRAELVVDLGFTAGQSGFQAEALVWGRNGVPIKGIAPMNMAVPGAVDAAGRVDVLIEAASNPDVGSLFTFEPTPLGDPATAGADPAYRLRAVDLAERDLVVTELLADVLALRGLIDELAAGSPRRAEILHGLDRMVDVIDPDDVTGTAAAGRAVLAPLLARPAHASAHVLHAVGHAHIDSAWLWPVRETARKVSRTFSNVLALMDEDPEVSFVSSSAQQFAWVKEYYPTLWTRLVERVRQGRFVPVGGMWVESDTNLPGGEALARQFLEGKGFFQSEFGIDSPEVWLPDSFGYTGAFPQIARAAGARWFLTQKISWNETNRMPHHTFQREGIDGTRLFTHFPPVDKYNSEVSAADLAHAERNFADKGRSTVSLLPYGYGDGGGGPTPEMAATIARTRSLEGSPVVRHSSSREFFEAAEQEYPLPEVWSGELYLEFHRGTYTSQLRTKQGNRRSEHLLREAELWATTAAVRVGAPYPAQRLKRLWQLVLLQQFHDILPGTSIAWVHRDAERNYEHIRAELTDIIETALRTLLGSGDRTVLANAAPHTRSGVSALAVGPLRPAPAILPVRDGESIVLHNGVIRVAIDRRGLITSLVDLATRREVIPPGQAAGLLQLHRDTPTQWDAWDIDEHYRRHVTDLVTPDQVQIDGNEVVVVHTFGESSVVQRLSLAADSRTVTFEVDIDWHERQKLLKLAFPIDVHTDRAAAEIQFGHIERPTHTNTSWDAARFETVAHRWVRVAEPDFGVAVTNDSTYGHDVTRQARAGGGTSSTVRLSLIRSALFPDPEADRGRHRLRVGLVAGAQVLQAVTEGYRMNLEERLVHEVAIDEVDPLVSVDLPGVVVEAIKVAEDGSGDVVVRLYEALGRRARARLTVGFPSRSVVETDLLERAVVADPVITQTSRSDEGVLSTDLSLRPFQLVTLRIARA